MVIKLRRRGGWIQQQPVPPTGPKRVVEHHFSTTRTQAFVVGTTEIVKLWEVLESFGDVEASVEYSNGRKIVYRSYKEFAADENPSTRRATQLILSAKTQDEERAIIISFLDRRSRNALISIERGDEFDLITQNKLSEILEGTRPWYSPLARLKLPFVLCYMYLAALCLDTWSRWPKLVKLSDIPWEPISLATLGFILAVVLMVFVMEGLDTLWRLVFPMGQYAWGQGERRQRMREMVHKIVISGVLGTLVGLLVQRMG